MPSKIEEPVLNGHKAFDNQKVLEAQKVLDGHKVLDGQTVLELTATNGHAVEPTWSGATRLKHLLRDSNELIVCPGVYDGLSARIAMSVGFSALYMVCYMFPSLPLLFKPVDHFSFRLVLERRPHAWEWPTWVLLSCTI